MENVPGEILTIAITAARGDDNNPSSQCTYKADTIHDKERRRDSRGGEKNRSECVKRLLCYLNIPYTTVLMFARTARGAHSRIISVAFRVCRISRGKISKERDTEKTNIYTYVYFISDNVYAQCMSELAAAEGPVNCKRFLIISPRTARRRPGPLLVDFYCGSSRAKISIVSSRRDGRAS